MYRLAGIFETFSYSNLNVDEYMLSGQFNKKLCTVILFWIKMLYHKSVYVHPAYYQIKQNEKRFARDLFSFHWITP